VDELHVMKVLSLADATAEQLDAADEANKVTHMSWVQQRTAGMQVYRDDQLIVIDSGLPTDTFNVVCRARLANDSLRERIAQVVTHFNTFQRPFSWWIGPADRPDSLGQALLEAGFVAAGSEPGMAADLNALHTTDLTPLGLRIERARTRKQVHDFATVLAALGTPPDLTVVCFYEAATSVLLAHDSPIWLYVGYLGEEPVSSAELTVSGGVVGVYSVAALVAHRRKGIGTAMTLRPLLDARAKGFRTAVLQASADGEGIHTRLGFRATGRFTEYQLPAA